MKSSQPALILIDIQKGFRNINYWGGQRNNIGAEKRSRELLGHWREEHLPIVHVQHCSTLLTSPLHETNEGNAFEEMVAPLNGEPVVRKKAHSAFIGTMLQDYLDRAGITTLVIAGLTTDHCVSTTVRMGSDFGYEVYVVADATATFRKNGANGLSYSAEFMHETALASLQGEFASVVTSDGIKEMMGFTAPIHNYKR